MFALIAAIAWGACAGIWLKNYKDSGKLRYLGVALGAAALAIIELVWGIWIMTQ